MGTVQARDPLCCAAYFSSAFNEFGPAVVLTAWMFHAMETAAERDLIWAGIRFGLELAECLALLS